VSTPEFSVIICTYNRPRLLARAVKSVLVQTFSNFEVIVVDDHSQQDMREIVEGFGDTRLRFLRQSQNRGVAHSTNLGLQAARGEYISILNDDDCYDATFLARMSQHLAATGVDFAWCGVEDAHEEEPEAYGRVARATRHSDSWALGELVTRVGLGFGFTIRRESLLRLGGLDENLRSSEDTELFLRLVQQPFTWQSLPDCLVKVFRQRDRLTQASPRRAEDLSYVLAKHQAFLQTMPSLVKHFQLVQASLYVEFGDRVRGRQALLALLRESVWQARVWVLLFANELGLGAKLLDGYRRLRAWASRTKIAGTG
jgi:glycosyltransferase involved in cell wall biosynthesis